MGTKFTFVFLILLVTGGALILLIHPVSAIESCNVKEDCYPEGFVLSSCGAFYSCLDNQCVVGSNSCAGAVCTDLDNGLNYNVKGKIMINGFVKATDTCSDAIGPNGPKLIEWFCNNSTDAGYVFEEYECPNECVGGACVEETSENTCTKYYTCLDGTKILECHSLGETCTCTTNPEQFCTPPNETSKNTCEKIYTCSDGTQKVEECQRVGNECVCPETPEELPSSICAGYQIEFPDSECKETYTCTDDTQVEKCFKVENGCACSIYPERLCESYDEGDKVCCKISYKSEDTINYLLTPKEACSYTVGSEKMLEVSESDFCGKSEKFESKIERECPSGCECTGSVTECLLEDGARTITITAGESGNIIIQIKGVEVKTNVILYHYNGKIYGEFKGVQREIKILPDEAKQKVEEEIETKIEEEEIELDEEGEYNIKAKKKARLFWVFPVSEKVQTAVNSETGIVGKVNAPWWEFLARDIK